MAGCLSPPHVQIEFSDLSVIYLVFEILQLVPVFHTD